MFEIGSHVIHPGQGICTVTGYDDQGAAPMIVLECKQGHAKTLMLYPVSQSDRLHAAISREEAQHVLDTYDDIECDPFTERNSSLEEMHFRQLIKQGVPETIRVAKTMRSRILDAERHSKKPSSYYARVLKEAHRRSVEELAVALECTEEQIEEVLAPHIQPSEN